MKKKNLVEINNTLQGQKEITSTNSNSAIVIDDTEDEEMKKLQEEEYILIQKEKELQERLEKALKSKKDNGAKVPSRTEKENTEELTKTVLEGLPAEIKLVVQEKFKTMSVIKRPIIMPSVAEDMPKVVTEAEPQKEKIKLLNTEIVKPEDNQSQRFTPKSVKPIEVRFLQNQSKPVAERPTTPASRASPLTPSPTSINNKSQRGQKFNIPSMYLPKGIPKTFLLQQSALGAIQPQQSFTPNNITKPPEWLKQTIDQPAPGGDNQSIGQPTMTMPQSQSYGPAQPYDQVSSAYIAQNFEQPVFANSQQINQAPKFAQNPQMFSQTIPVHANTQTYGQTSSLACVSQLKVDTGAVGNSKQVYSPSDIFDDNLTESRDSSPDGSSAGQKRLSAFKRLGPLAQSKKPKLTINLMLNTDQHVREVVDETKKTDEKYTPVRDRKDIATSTDVTVMKYLVHWPWNNSVAIKKSVSPKSSKSIMLVEAEQMNVFYDNDHQFIQVAVTGYPTTWSKEDVLDSLLKNVGEKSLIPCFVEFTEEECKFLVIRNRLGLMNLQKTGLRIQQEEVEMSITISAVDLKLKNLDFIPRQVLRKRLLMAAEETNKLNLKAFTLQSDLSHFIYYPLNRMKNQVDLLQLHSTSFWESLTELDLSHNRLTNITCFNLAMTSPKLKHLDLSYNRFDSALFLSKSRELNLLSLKLEGNPLCHNYIHADHYVKVLKIMFPTLKEIVTTRTSTPRGHANSMSEPMEQLLLESWFVPPDIISKFKNDEHSNGLMAALLLLPYFAKGGRASLTAIMDTEGMEWRDGTRIKLQGEFPEYNKFHCNEEAVPVVDKFLRIFFPLLDSSDGRPLLQNLYDKNAMLTVTYRDTLRINSKYKHFRYLFLRARNFNDGQLDVVKGAGPISKHIDKWPPMKHDPHTFTVDLLHHDETTTIFRVDGLMKLTGETLAEDEQLIAFTRTLVLGTDDTIEYKVHNEMVYWDEPLTEYATKAFQISTVPQKQLTLNLETTPDDYIKEKLIEIFMKITDLEKNSATRCLEMKDWNLKIALEHFIKLTKLDSIDYLLTAKV